MLMPAMAAMGSSDRYGGRSTARRWDDDPRVGSGTAAVVANSSSPSSPPPSPPPRPGGGGPPPLDFAVVSVPDAMRSECPGCSSAFTYTRRRHHCRLCGVSFVFVVVVVLSFVGKRAIIDMWNQNIVYTSRYINTSWPHYYSLERK